MKFYTVLVVLSVLGSSFAVPLENDEADEGVSTTSSPDQSAKLEDGESLPLTKEELKDAVLCENGTLHLATEFKMKVKHCMMDSEHYGTEEGKKHPHCAFFCQARSIHVLGDDGMPTKELYDEFIQNAFPETYQEKVKEAAHKCIDDMGGKIDPKDEKCEGAGAFNQCIHKVFEMEC